MSAKAPGSKLLPGVLLAIIALIPGFMLGLWLGSFQVSTADGLAGGAIVFMWGVLGAVFLLIASIVVSIKITRRMLWQIVAVAGPIALVVLLALTWRFIQQREKERLDQEHERDRMRIPTASAEPVSLQVHYNGSIQVEVEVMGLGMARPDMRSSVLHFLTGPDDERPVDSVVFAQGTGMFAIVEAPPWLLPAHMKLDYDILLLRVLALSRTAVEVEVNAPLRMSKWVPRDQVDVLLWPEFLLAVHSIEPIGTDDLVVRVKPLDHASEVAVREDAILRPLLVRGQWIKVSAEQLDHDQGVTGWLRWTDGDRLLISYALLS
ncbi:MAG: hypothetical protein KDB88_12610 [Flavobacteriales bacterium]|nr:hypothetical protein [Flavobacteriales bacterium]